MTTNFVDSAEAGDAVAFQSHFEDRMKDKIGTVLDALKIEVAKKVFNGEQDEEQESN